MKNSRICIGIALVACLVETVAGCHTGERKTQPAGIEPATAIRGAPIDEGRETDLGREPFAGQPQYGQFGPVHFDYESATITTPERPVIERVAAHLRANPRDRLLVEGHCDERGSNEYNLALGERRAIAVRAYLVALGIEAQRIQTISYGEERPACAGHDEEAWRGNRRAEFALFPGTARASP